MNYLKTRIASELQKISFLLKESNYQNLFKSSNPFRQFLDNSIIKWNLKHTLVRGDSAASEVKAKDPSDLDKRHWGFSDKYLKYQKEKAVKAKGKSKEILDYFRKSIFDNKGSWDIRFNDSKLMFIITEARGSDTPIKPFLAKIAKNKKKITDDLEKLFYSLNIIRAKEINDFKVEFFKKGENGFAFRVSYRTVQLQSGYHGIKVVSVMGSYAGKDYKVTREFGYSFLDNDGNVLESGPKKNVYYFYEGDENGDWKELFKVTSLSRLENLVNRRLTNSDYYEEQDYWDNYIQLNKKDKPLTKFIEEQLLDEGTKIKAEPKKKQNSIDYNIKIEGDDSKTQFKLEQKNLLEKSSLIKNKVIELLKDKKLFPNELIPKLDVYVGPQSKGIQVKYKFK